MKSDQELLEAYFENDEQTAFAVLIERHFGMVYRVGRRMSLDHAAAEDIAMRVFNLLAKQNGNSIISLSAWLYGVARRQTLNEIRRSRRSAEREKQYGEIMRNEKTSEVLNERELRELRCVFDESLDELSDGQRQAVVLRYLEGYDKKSAAAIAGCPQGTLGRWASEGLKKLRGILTKRGVTLAAPVLLSWLCLEAEAAKAVPVPENLISQLDLPRSLSQRLNETNGAWKKMLSAKAMIIGSLAILLTALTGTLLPRHKEPKIAEKVLKRSTDGQRTPKIAENRMKKVILAGKSTPNQSDIDFKKGKHPALEDDEILFKVFLEGASRIETDTLELFLISKFKKVGDGGKYEGVGFTKKILDTPPRVLVRRSDWNKLDFDSGLGLTITSSDSTQKKKDSGLGLTITSSDSKQKKKDSGLGLTITSSDSKQKKKDSSFQLSIKDANSNSGDLEPAPVLPALMLDVEGYLPSELYHLDAARGAPRDIYVNLRQGPEFSGLVVDIAGNPVPEIKVELFQWPEKHVSYQKLLDNGKIMHDFKRRTFFSGISSRDGSFDCFDFNYGRIIVKAIVPGRNSSNFSIDFTPDSPLPWRFVVASGSASLSGRFVDEQNRPVPNVPLNLTLGRKKIASDKSNSEGYFRFGAVLPGKYRLRVNETQYSQAVNADKYQKLAPISIDLSADEDIDLGDIRLGSGYTAHGRITGIRETKNLQFKIASQAFDEETTLEIKRKFEHIKRWNPISAPKFVEYLEDLERSDLYLRHGFLTRLFYPSVLYDSKNAQTDLKGEFQVANLNDAPYFVSSRNGKYYSPNLLLPNADEQLIDLKPCPQVRLKGKITTEGGEPLEECGISVCANGQSVERNIETDDGIFSYQFHVDDLLCAMFKEEYQKESHVPIIIKLKAKGYQPRELDFDHHKLDENLVYDLGEIVLRKKNVQNDASSQ